MSKRAKPIATFRLEPAEEGPLRWVLFRGAKRLRGLCGLGVRAALGPLPRVPHLVRVYGRKAKGRREAHVAHVALGDGYAEVWFLKPNVAASLHPRWLPPALRRRSRTVYLEVVAK